MSGPSSENFPDLLPIGAAARLSGVKVPTIRFYEEIGLMPALPRTEGNRRLYSATHLQRLAFIRHARELGFDIEAIRTLLTLQDRPEQSCAAADEIASARLIEVRSRIAALRALEAELQRMVDGCAHGHVAQCRVIETLSDHGQCQFHNGQGENLGIGRNSSDLPSFSGTLTQRF
ncbi:MULTISPECIES: MerR family transcriptional regulator [Xanthobacter]|jgi:DNA-binding transcriptional MerR regulator|uniref:MerR family transcriptional regulator n=1 Tax=Xanthobacter TaxID=279 RepID=UPI001ACCDBC7|nr:helix-turn-helix domain-containing protein [Hyphomicrobiales bacterium]